MQSAWAILLQNIWAFLCAKLLGIMGFVVLLVVCSLELMVAVLLHVVLVINLMVFVVLLVVPVVLRINPGTPVTRVAHWCAVAARGIRRATHGI